MKFSITMDEFPMLLLDAFKEDLAKYVKANVQTGGVDTVFVTFESNDIAKAQCGIIICDKYHFAKGGDFGEKEDSS